MNLFQIYRNLTMQAPLLQRALLCKTYSIAVLSLFFENLLFCHNFICNYGAKIQINEQITKGIRRKFWSVTGGLLVRNERTRSP